MSPAKLIRKDPPTACGIVQEQAATMDGCLAVCTGVPIPVIREALCSFGTSYRQDASTWSIGKGSERSWTTLIIRQAFARSAAVRNLSAGNGSCIGVVGISGDRRDQDILEMGEISAGLFDRLILKEEHDLRGRPAGQAAAILREGALKAGLEPSKIEVVLGEHQAVRRALRVALKGDLVVITADDIDRVWEQVTAQPAEDLDDLHPVKEIFPCSLR